MVKFGENPSMLLALKLDIAADKSSDNATIVSRPDAPLATAAPAALASTTAVMTPPPPVKFAACAGALAVTLEFGPVTLPLPPPHAATNARATVGIK